MSELDDHLTSLAEAQHGLVADRQVRALGLSRAAWRHRVARGDWERLDLRVVRRRGSPASDQQRALAGVLSVGPPSFVSHRAGAAMWGVPGFLLDPVQVMGPRPRQPTTPLAEVHIPRLLPDPFAAVLDGVPVVRPALLLLQLAPLVHPDRLARILDGLWSRRLLSGPSVRRELEPVMHRGRPGTAVLRQLLDSLPNDYVPPASNLEARFARILADAGLPAMRAQVDLGDDQRWCGRVDFLALDLPLVVEVDSDRFHAALTDRQHDRARHEALTAAGFTVAHVAEHDIWHRRDDRGGRRPGRPPALPGAGSLSTQNPAPVLAGEVVARATDVPASSEPVSYWQAKWSPGRPIGLPVRMVGGAGEGRGCGMGGAAEWRAGEGVGGYGEGAGALDRCPASDRRARMHDLVIRGGTVVDGTGAPARTADVAIDDGRIIAVGRVTEEGRQEIDADGALVTPGWVDIHTHYDGQATWDDVLAPSAVARRDLAGHGQLRRGLRPRRAGPPRLADRAHGGRRGHPRHRPGRGHRLGVGDLPRVPRRPRPPRAGPMDVGTQIAHGAVRAYVMGERGARNEPATPDDIAAMTELVARGGRAPGPSASPRRAPSPTRPSTASPSPAPSPPRTSCSASGGALAELGAGVFELAPMGSAGEDIVARPGGRLDAPAVGRHRPARHLRPAPGGRRPRAVARADGRLGPGRCRAGRRHVARRSPVARPGCCRGTDTTYSLFDAVPAYQERRPGTWPTTSWPPLCATRGPRVDPRLGARPRGHGRPQGRRLRRTFPAGRPARLRARARGHSLAGLAAASGVDPLEVAYDAMLADGGDGLLYVPILNYAEGNLEPIREMLLPPPRRARAGRRRGALRGHLRRLHARPSCSPTGPATAPGASACRSSWWCRRRPPTPPALYGLGDRGTLTPGLLGDVNVIDLRGPAPRHARRSRPTCPPAAGGWCRAPTATWPPSSPARSPADGERHRRPPRAAWSAAPARRHEGLPGPRAHRSPSPGRRHDIAPPAARPGPGRLRGRRRQLVG